MSGCGYLVYVGYTADFHHVLRWASQMYYRSNLLKLHDTYCSMSECPKTQTANHRLAVYDLSTLTDPSNYITFIRYTRGCQTDTTTTESHSHTCLGLNTTQSCAVIKIPHTLQQALTICITDAGGGRGLLIVWKKVNGPWCYPNCSNACNSQGVHTVCVSQEATTDRVPLLHSESHPNRINKFPTVTE